MSVVPIEFQEFNVGEDKPADAARRGRVANPHIIRRERRAVCSLLHVSSGTSFSKVNERYFQKRQTLKADTAPDRFYLTRKFTPLKF